MKVIALISGGLDSTLAARLMRDSRLELIALNTTTPFCLCNRKSSSGCIHGASIVAKDLGLKLFTVDVSGEFLAIVKNPPHGYGSNMNPCIDCRILLFKKAKELMQAEGASFVITGEVLGQRPMSQKLRTMKLIEDKSGLTGLVLRPLSARVLEETIPEKQGWVQREKLLAISGRGRRDQIDLAKNFAIFDYPCPSGGCLLTDPEFSRRLKELLVHDEFRLKNIYLLKVGRHFRLDQATKLVVGRNQSENSKLEAMLEEGDLLFTPDEQTAGPTCLGRGRFNKELVELSCRIASRYCDSNGKADVDITCKSSRETETQTLRVLPLEEDRLISLRI